MTHAITAERRHEKNSVRNTALPDLRQLWRTLLDLPPHYPLHDHSHFFELGGGSMLLLSLQVAIAREFAVELAVDALLANPTLGQMKELLQQAGVDA